MIIHRKLNIHMYSKKFFKWASVINIYVHAYVHMHFNWSINCLHYGFSIYLFLVYKKALPFSVVISYTNYCAVLYSIYAFIWLKMEYLEIPTNLTELRQTSFVSMNMPNFPVYKTCNLLPIIEIELKIKTSILITWHN